MRLVVGLERQDIEPTIADDDGSRILRRDVQPIFDLPCGDVHDRDLVLRRQRDIHLIVAGERDAHRFVEASRFGRRIKILDGCNDLKASRTGWISIDHANRIGNVIRNPGFFAIRPHRDANRVDAHADSPHDRVTLRVDDIHRGGRRVRDENHSAAHRNRGRMRTHEGRMPDGGGRLWNASIRFSGNQPIADRGMVRVFPSVSEAVASQGHNGECD